MLVYGKNVAIEFLTNNVNSIRKIIFQDNFKDKNIISLAENAKLPIIFKAKMEMDRLAKGVHQGIILDVADYNYYDNFNDLINGSNFVVILDHLEDPHNFGAIIRTCEAFKVDAIIIPRDRGVSVNSTVMKTSVGTVNRMKIVRVTNLCQTINKLKENGFWVVGTAMDGIDYTSIDYSGKIALVIGNEGDGMSRLVREKCDFCASIPMMGDVNSLNASVACGIMISEVVRNRK